MRRKIDTEIKAGIFVFLGLIVVLATILLMGGGESLLQKNVKLYVVVPDATGVAKGAVVRSGGLKVGRVGEIQFSENYQDIKITMLIADKYQQRIKKDSFVKFQTQGVLGDKFLEIAGGDPTAPAAEDGAVLVAEDAKDLSKVLADGTSAVQLLKENLANLKVVTSSLAKGNVDKIFRDLAETTANLKLVTRQLKDGTSVAELNKSLRNIRLVTDKMKNGEGTLGALFNDSSLYEDLKNLIGGANRNNVLKFFVRQAVKSSDDAAAQAEEQKKKEKDTNRKPGSAKK